MVLAELSGKRLIFVVGGPGSGKQTQSEKIGQKYGLTHVSTSVLLRQEVQSGSDRGKKLQEIMAKGELVPVDTVLGLLKESLVKQAGASKGFLVDGYPREVDQGTRFEAEVGPVEKVLYFEASDATLKSRLQHRAATNPRFDDNPDAFDRRIATFHAKTGPVVAHYEKLGKVVKISAEGSADQVFAEVQKHL